MKNEGVYEIDREEFDSIYVLGDLHGDLDSFKSFLDKSKENELVVTLGDYTDRGESGVEVIELLKQAREERNLIPLKGNHESYTEEGMPKFSPSTFVEEVRSKKGTWKDYFKEKYKPFLESLYIGAILKGKYLLIHGGITSEIKDPGDLIKYEQKVKWSDPINKGSFRKGKCENCTSRCPFSMRKRPKFTSGDSKEVCENLNVEKIIRSHQPNKAKKGPVKNHEQRVITVSSTSVYGGEPFALRAYTKEPKIEVIYKNRNKKEMKFPTQD